MYASSSVVSQNKLKDQWDALQQKPGQALSHFMQDLEYLASSLEAAGVPKDDKDKLHRLLKGMSSDWGQEKRFFELSGSGYDAVCLKLNELSIAQDEAAEQRKIVPAYSTRHAPGYGQNQRGGGNLSPTKRGSYPTRGPITCFVCGSDRHFSNVCPT
jgi:hypothetical protein